MSERSSPDSADYVYPIAGRWRAVFRDEHLRDKLYRIRNFKSEQAALDALAACSAPAQAAEGDPVAWRYCHKGQGDWCMLKDGQDPTKWLATFNGEYEIQPLYAAQPQAAISELINVCKAVERHCQVADTPGDPAAHAIEGKKLRARMKEAVNALSLPEQE